MSQWRRFAIEEVPFCKQAIEQATDPYEMWTNIYEQLERAYGETPQNETKISQIYRFAFRCHQNKGPKHICRDVWIFFERLFSNGREIEDDLPNRVPASVFNYFQRSFEDWYSQSRSDHLTRKYHAAKHQNM